MKTLEQAVIQKIESELGIHYLDDTSNGNICYRNNNSELRNEFKETFSESDLECFIGSFQKEELQIPTDPLQFWERVQRGKLNT